MALEDFWRMIRLAIRTLNRGVVDDAPRFEQNELSSHLSRAQAFWYSPKIVKDYQPSDFGFLAPEERLRLDDAATQFKHIVNTKTDYTETTEEGRQDAQDALLTIINLFEFDRFNDPVAFEIGKRIEQQIVSKLPIGVDHVRYRAGLDHSGEPALWVTVYLDVSPDSDEQTTWEIADECRPIVEEAAGEVSPDRFPYVTFRSIHEVVEVQ